MKILVAFAWTFSLAPLILGGCETQSSSLQMANAGSGQCLDVYQILSVMPQNSRTIDVVTHSNAAYALELGSPCLDIKAQSRPAIIPRNGDLICGQGDADVTYPGYNARSSQICRVVSVRHMSPAEAANLINGSSK